MENDRTHTIDGATDALIDAADDTITFLVHPEHLTITAATSVILARRLSDAIGWIGAARDRQQAAATGEQTT